MKLPLQRKAEEKAKAADIAMKRYSELRQRVVTLNLHLSHHYGRPGPSGQSVGKWLKEKEECAAEALELALKYGFPTENLL